MEIGGGRGRWLAAGHGWLAAAAAAWKQPAAPGEERKEP
jgi:hypothetical protein